MTAEERSQIVALTQAFHEFRVEVTKRIEALTGELRELCATTHIEIDHLKRQCDERHGHNVEAIKTLKFQERDTWGWRQRLVGMAVPVALCVSIVAVILSVVY